MTHDVLACGVVRVWEDFDGYHRVRMAFCACPGQYVTHVEGPAPAEKVTGRVTCGLCQRSLFADVRREYAGALVHASCLLRQEAKDRTEAFVKLWNDDSLSLEDMVRVTGLTWGDLAKKAGRMRGWGYVMRERRRNGGNPRSRKSTHGMKVAHDRAMAGIRK